MSIYTALTKKEEFSRTTESKTVLTFHLRANISLALVYRSETYSQCLPSPTPSSVRRD